VIVSFARGFDVLTLKNEQNDVTVLLNKVNICGINVSPTMNWFEINREAVKLRLHGHAPVKTVW
jgi:hypothetical protein